MIRIGGGDLAIESSASALRSALALSCASGLPFRWEGFRRDGSPSPGLRRVDAESVRLFAHFTGARVDGGGVGEDTVELEPGPVLPGEHRFELPADEPLMPLLRVALMPLALAGRESSLFLAGSTHAPGGETFEVVSSTFHYFLGKLGIDVSLALECAGFAPRGGGEVSARLGSRPGVTRRGSRSISSTERSSRASKSFPPAPLCPRTCSSAKRRAHAPASTFPGASRRFSS